MKNIDHKFRLMLIYALLAFACTSTVFSAYATSNTLDSNRVHLKVKYKEAKVKDTLVLLLAPKYLNNYEGSNLVRIESTVDSSGVFDFTAKMDTDFGYWQLFKKNEFDPSNRSLQVLTQQFFWERSDNIKLDLSNKPTRTGIYSEYLFSGHGSEKYTVQKQMKEFWKEASVRPYPKDPDTAYLVSNKFVCRRLFKLIDDNASGMSPLSSSILKSEIVMTGGYAIYDRFQTLLKSNKNASIDSVRKALYQKCTDLFSGRGLIPHDTIAFSKSSKVIDFQIAGLKTESEILFGKQAPIWIYNQIKARFNGSTRDELISSFISFSRNDEKVDSLYIDAIKVVKSKSAIEQLKRVAHLFSRPTFGDYVLMDRNNIPFNLRKLQGKIIFIDFWWTGCGACTQYYKNVLSKAENAFRRDSNIVFVSISVDKSPQKWISSVRSGIYTGEAAINLYTNGRGFLHPIVTENNVQAGPTVMLLDETYKIKYFNTQQLYNAESLIEAIRTLTKT